MKNHAAVLRVFCALFLGGPAFAAGPDVNRIHGLEAKALLGDGTGVVIGIVDSGVDDAHPALTGTVSGGLSRMVAEANFVTTESSNTGDDVFGHGTAVAGVLMSRDPVFYSVATDARFVNARVLDSANSFTTDAWVINGVGFALSNGANLLNLSLGYFNSNTSGTSRLSLMADYVVSQLHIPMVVSAGNAGNNTNHLPQGPGEAYDVISAASTQSSTYHKIANGSSYGPTTDGRTKPDLAAPGDQINTASSNWETQADFQSWSGTSFAAPNIAALMAAQIEFGTTHALSRDPLVLKATLLNSAEKINNRSNAGWTPNSSSSPGGVLTVTSPLDSQSGAGQVDGLKLYEQYSPGEMSPGEVASTGWDLATIGGISFLDYHLGMLTAGSSLAATLTWNRKVGWTDNGNSILDAGDSFALLETLDNLDLAILRDGNVIARSISTLDNLEHLYLIGIAGGDYAIRVNRLSGGGTNEEFGLAWAVVPEPSAVGFLLAAALTLFSKRRR